MNFEIPGKTERKPVNTTTIQLDYFTTRMKEMEKFLNTKRESTPARHFVNKAPLIRIVNQQQPCVIKQIETESINQNTKKEIENSQIKSVISNSGFSSSKSKSSSKNNYQSSSEKS